MANVLLTCVANVLLTCVVNVLLTCVANVLLTCCSLVRPSLQRNPLRCYLTDLSWSAEPGQKRPTNRLTKSKRDLQAFLPHRHELVGSARSHGRDVSRVVTRVRGPRVGCSNGIDVGMEEGADDGAGGADEVCGWCVEVCGWCGHCARGMCQ